MSSADVKIFQVFLTDSPEVQMDVRGLGVKDNLFVVSNIEPSKAWEDALEALDDTDPRKKFNVQIGAELSVEQLVGLFGDLVPETVEVRDGVTGKIVSAEPDTEKPVITLLGDNPLLLNNGDNYNDPGAEATDAVDGDITDQIVVGGDLVDADTDGTYNVTYNVTDQAGNQADEVTRVVTVSTPV